ncbi:MAG: hypothetical protein ACPHRO_09760, partial [Nannocystaceae bacterium]
MGAESLQRPPDGRLPQRSWRESYDHGRLAVTVALGLYGVLMVFTPDEFRFMDWVDLVFHEAGHLFFTPLGRVMHFLGGTLGQLFWPIACGIYFWRRSQRFSSAVMVLWLGQNMFNIARYMKDAVLTELPLVGGGMHDWNWLLSRYHLLHRAQLFGNLVYALGVALV